MCLCVVCESSILSGCIHHWHRHTKKTWNQKFGIAEVFTYKRTRTNNPMSVFLMFLQWIDLQCIVPSSFSVMSRAGTVAMWSKKLSIFVEIHLNSYVSHSILKTFILKTLSLQLDLVATNRLKQNPHKSSTIIILITWNCPMLLRAAPVSRPEWCSSYADLAALQIPWMFDPFSSQSQRFVPRSGKNIKPAI